MDQVASSPASTQVRSSPKSSWSSSPPLKRARSDGWKEGWKADAETLSSAPRWSMGGKAGVHSPEKKVYTTNNVSWPSGGGSRDTWIQAHARKSDTPGPGKYRTDMDLPMQKCKGYDWLWATDPAESDTYAIQNTRKERTLKTTFSKSANEVLRKDVRLGPDKPSYMQVRERDGTSSQVMSTPGPGHYVQNTQFGAASGGHRHHYFPQTPGKGASSGAAESPVKSAQRSQVGVKSE